MRRFAYIESINAFFAAYSSRDSVRESLIAATVSTMGEYSHMYSSKMELVVSILLARGTQSILEGTIIQSFCSTLLYVCLQL
jgi:hypothetical protein